MEIEEEIVEPEIDTSFLLKTEIRIKDEFLDDSFDELEKESGGCCFANVCKTEIEESDEELPLPCIVTVEGEADIFEYNESELAEDLPTNVSETTENVPKNLEPQGDQNFTMITHHSKKVKVKKRKKKRGREIFFCHHCGKRYRYKKSFDFHLQTYHNEESQEDCRVISNDSNETDLNQIKKERNPESYFCQECGKRYRHSKSYKFHLLTHHNKRSYYCIVCDNAFPSTTECKKHEQTHTEFKCRRCGSVAHGLRSLRRHMDKHLNDKIYNCIKCDMKFEREALKYHMLSHMPEDEEFSGKRYLCDRCGKTFAARNTLAKHMMKHFDEKGASHECKDCGKKFMAQNGLNFHIQKFHTMHKCNYCEKEYKERRVLLRHIKELHVGVREHECEFCGASFTRADRLMEHVRLHTGERPYACNMCDMKYASSSVLRNHKKITHFGMKLGRKNNSDSEAEREVPLSELLRRLDRKKAWKKGKKNSVM